MACKCAVCALGTHACNGHVCMEFAHVHAMYTHACCLNAWMQYAYINLVWTQACHVCVYVPWVCVWAILAFLFDMCVRLQCMCPAQNWEQENIPFTAALKYWDTYTLWLEELLCFGKVEQKTVNSLSIKYWEIISTQNCFRILPWDF